MNNKLISLLLLFFLSSLTYANDSEDKRPVFLEETESTVGKLYYGDFLECLRTGDFPPDHGPRKINTKNQRLILTHINDQQWAIEIREYMEKVIIKNIVVDTRNIYTKKDKSRYLLHLLSHCKIENKKTEEVTTN